MPVEHAVADVERLVLHQQPDDLAVGHVDHRLARLRIAEPALRVRQRPDLVEAVQVGPGQPVRLAERGYELDELDDRFKEWNGHLGPDGRLTPDIPRV